VFDGTRVTTSTIVARNYDSWSFDRIEVLKGRRLCSMVRVHWRAL
jgi:hypothetical protein